MKMKNLLSQVLCTLALIGSTIGATAAPILRDIVVVISPIVTVGDMFDDAGIFAEHPLFRSPAPGTIGQVSLQSIRIASAKIGIENFENPGFANISVTRRGINVDLSTFESLIASDLQTRGILRDGMSVTAFLTREMEPLFAQDSATPVTLANLRYTSNSNRFSARFLVAGIANPVDISGRLDFTILAPHLVRALPSGTILKADDIEMRTLPLQFASNLGIPTLDQLIGRQLRRNQLDGVTLRLNDVIDPVLISRNQTVTLFLKAGAMTLTVKGQALEDASAGGAVSVLNLMSNTVVHGIAVGPNSVEIRATSTSVASL